MFKTTENEFFHNNNFDLVMILLNEVFSLIYMSLIIFTKTELFFKSKLTLQLVLVEIDKNKNNFYSLLSKWIQWSINVAYRKLAMQVGLVIKW